MEDVRVKCVWESVCERERETTRNVKYTKYYDESLTWVVGYDDNASVEPLDGLCEGTKGFSV